MNTILEQSVFSLLAILVLGIQVHGLAKCGNGIEYFEVWKGSCYYFPPVSEYITYANAKKKCEDLGATLASIHAEDENEYIFNKMSALNSYYVWIGLIKDKDDEPVLKDNYYWMDGSEKVYENWAPGEPNGALGVEDCTEMYISFYYPRQWNDVPCTGYTKDGFICKTKAEESWVTYSGSEYFISYQSKDTQLNWYDARKWCMDQGGDLVSVTSQGEATQVAEWATKNAFKGGLWIGANKLQGDRRKWTWSDLSSWSYTNWKSGYPNDNNYGHLCGYQESGDIEGKWINGHCDDANRGFICKRPAGITPTPKSDPVTPEVTGFCPAGFIGSGNKCFMVKALTHDKGITFSDAVTTCRQQDGFLPDLASITSDLDQAFITSQLQSITYGLWVGLYRPSWNDEWRWVDNSPRAYNNWAPNEPSGNEDHCAEVWVVPGPLGTWNNVNCKQKRGYVCQTYKDVKNPIVTPPSTTTHTCLEGFTPYWYGCFKYQEKMMPWTVAQDECRKLDSNANLVGIHHDAENAAVRTILLDKGRDIWTGFVDIEKTGEYKWKDSWMTFYTNWAVGQPRRENDQAGCVKMSVDGTWSDAICSIEIPSICKISQIGAITSPKPKEGQCPQRSGWEEYHDHCYYFAPQRYVNWETAKKECQILGYGSSLASIHSEIENSYVYDVLHKKGGGRTSAWIGLYRSKKDNSFRWVDYSSIQFEAWAPGEPNGEERSENCVEMYNQYWPGRWNDHYCNDLKGYVCKAPKMPKVTFPPPSDYCPEGWSYFEKACYLFQPDENMIFSSAKQKCKELGGSTSELASIHDWAENEFIELNMYWGTQLPQHTNFYIGMSKNKGGEPYQWEDGSEVDFEYWATSEPSDPDGDYENCVEMVADKGRWNDISCTEVRGMVCKMSASNSQDSLSGGAIAGIVIGTLLGVILIAVIVAAILTQRRVIDNPLGRFKISHMTV